MQMLDADFHIASPKWKRLFMQHQLLFKNALNETKGVLVLPKKQFTVAVSLIDDAEMQRLNKQYRGMDKPTNVLSFPLLEDFTTTALKKEPEPIELGDIVLAYETIIREAEEQKKTPGDHVAHLLVHGLLHLFGYDHMQKKEAEQMEELEIRVLEELGISNPYL